MYISNSLGTAINIFLHRPFPRFDNLLFSSYPLSSFCQSPVFFIWPFILFEKLPVQLNLPFQQMTVQQNLRISPRYECHATSIQITLRFISMSFAFLQNKKKRQNLLQARFCLSIFILHSQLIRSSSPTQLPGRLRYKHPEYPECLRS